LKNNVVGLWRITLKEANFMSGQINAIDVFAGCGAFTYGLQENPAIKVIKGIDHDKNCVYPFEFNNKAPLQLIDANLLTKEDFCDFNKLAGPRLVVGSPPCQPFSPMGLLKGKKQHDWGLVSKFGDIVKWTMPDIVVMENVSGLVSHVVFQELLRTLDSLGYCYHYYKAFNCLDIGVPQKRKRLILLAARIPRLIMLKSTVSEPKNLQQAIGDLPAINAGEVCRFNPLHRASNLTDAGLARARAAKAGGGWADLPDDLIPTRFKTGKKVTHARVYGRLMWDQPSPTLLTKFYNAGTAGVFHPDKAQARALSLLEGARIQTFPDSFRFVGHDRQITFHNIGRLIGNAVPVLLARAIGAAVVEYCQSLGL
jgi:DNA (cytosine-5)-methyltransferase 1